MAIVGKAKWTFFAQENKCFSPRHSASSARTSPDGTSVWQIALYLYSTQGKVLRIVPCSVGTTAHLGEYSWGNGQLPKNVPILHPPMIPPWFSYISALLRGWVTPGKDIKLILSLNIKLSLNGN